MVPFADGIIGSESISRLAYLLRNNALLANKFAILAFNILTLKGLTTVSYTHLDVYKRQILYGCSSKGTSSSNSVSGEGEIPTDKMTYRTSPTTGDRVSLLGYGCMRWPLKPSPDGNGEVIDQDAVNGLVDYAIAHGVNYFDTSPAYVQGFSEKATGIALDVYKRQEYISLVTAETECFIHFPKVEFLF